MTGRNYSNFDLVLRSIDDEFDVEARYGDRSASRRFRLPFAEAELTDFLRSIRKLNVVPDSEGDSGTGNRADRAVGSVTPSRVVEFGQQMYETVFRDDVLGLLESAMADTVQSASGLRFRLALGDALPLIDLPWELLHDGTRFFALSSLTPIVRYFDLPGPATPKHVKRPVRILVMISNPPGTPRLDVEEEWARLQSSLAGLMDSNLVDLQRMEDPTMDGLLDRLVRETFHVFHFIGHGALRESGGVLLMKGPKGGSADVTGDQLAVPLHDHEPLRLVVLNSCEGGATTASHPFLGVAQTLIQKGIPCVAAMQSRISDRAAILFAQGFYRALATGCPVDEALSEGRKTIFGDLMQISELEWATPVMYMRVPDGLAFDIGDLSAEERRVLDFRTALAGFWRPVRAARVNLVVGKRQQPFALKGEVEPVVGLPYALAIGEIRQFLSSLYNEVNMTDDPADIDGQAPTVALGGPLVNSLTQQLHEREGFPYWFQGELTKKAARTIGGEGDTFASTMKDGRLVSDVGFFVRLNRTTEAPTIVIAGCYGAGTLGVARYLFDASMLEPFSETERVQGVVRTSVWDWDAGKTDLRASRSW